VAALFLLLVVAAVLGLVIGLLVVGSLSLRRTRRARRKRLRQVERELRSKLLELDRENIGLCRSPPQLLRCACSCCPPTVRYGIT